MSDVEVAEVEVGEGTASVQSFGNGWHLITYGTWQVSVSPDGMVRLPILAVPDSVGDLVEALKVAAEVGLRVQAENEARAAASPRTGISLSRGGLVIQSGQPPAGAMRLPVVPRLVEGN